MAQTFTLPIENMTCGGCAARVGKILSAVDAVSNVRVNFAAATAEVTMQAEDGLYDLSKTLRASGYPITEEQVHLSVSGLTCASCAASLTAAFDAHPGVQRASVNVASDTAEVSFIPSMTSEETLTDVARRAGYPARVVKSRDPSVQQHDAAHGLRASVLWAALLTLPVFVMEMGSHLFPAMHHLIAHRLGTQLSWTIQAILTTLVLIGPGRVFFKTGVPALWQGQPTMNSLVALGAGAAWCYSMVALLLPDWMPEGTQAVYFEAAAVIVTLILLGKWFEARAKAHTGAAIQKLLNLAPATARVRTADTWVDRPLSALRPGDVIMVQPGARVPTDAQITEGESRIDESMITGEPMPVRKGPGDAVTGGTLNGSGSLICEALRTGEATTLAHIIRMVQQAQSARLPIQALVDRITLWFVPTVLVIAALTMLLWLVLGPEPRLPSALVAGVCVLIIACPCAMGLATPTSIMVGSGRGAELGVLFRQGDALQSLSDVRLVAFDKTGTLTKGAPSLTAFEVAPSADAPTVLARLAAVEAHSEHPLALAVRQAAEAQDLPAALATDIEVFEGRGIAGNCEGTRYVIGNAKLMADEGVDISAFAPQADSLRAKGQSVFFAAAEGQLLCLLAVSDPLRPESRSAIAALKASGLEVAMITGDAETTAQAVAAELGIDHVFAQTLPAEKRDKLRELKTQFGAVAFVGDGINDAPVLAEADVGIAIGTGTDIAVETADVVLMSNDLQGVLRAFELSKKTLRNIKQNLGWAFGYNVLLIPVAAGVLYPAFGLLLSPGLAAGAMAFSSVFVLVNALRLRQAGRA
ncbi:MAG: heavy metal translocating P-type ATPase [Pseudomonadota bacterium]